MSSLQRRLTAGLIAVFAVLVAAGAAALYLAVRAALQEQFDTGLRVKALIVITATEQRRGKIDVDFSDRFLREFDDDVATDFFQVWVAGGASVDRSGSLRRRDLPQRFGSMERPVFWDLPLPVGGAPGRAIGIKFTPHFDRGDERTRRNPLEAIVVVAGHRGALDAMLRRVAWLLAGGGVGLLIATSVAVPLVLRPGLRPLRRVADQAAAIDATTLTHRFPTADLPAELAPICERLNALLARLETSFERERRFSADLAHELLTPLAEMRVIAESALKWPDTAGPEAHRQSLEILVRMETLVSRLLELARAEHGRVAVNRTGIDLPTALHDTWRAYAAGAAAKRLDVTFDGPAAAEIVSDAALLRVIAGNLFSNAVDHSAAGSPVRIAWSAGAESWALEVRNPAPQLAPEDVAQLFDRLWRKDPARTGAQHSGLGLAVARELAHALGGSLEATLTHAGELTFTLRVPAAGAGTK